GLHHKSDDEQTGNQNGGDAGDGFRKGFLLPFRFLCGTFFVDLFFGRQGRFLVRGFLDQRTRRNVRSQRASWRKWTSTCPEGKSLSSDEPALSSPRLRTER